MKRTSVALLLLVVFLAACGSSGTSVQPPMPGTVTSATGLTPTAYRARVNALCSQAKHQLGSTSASSAASSQAAAVAAINKALGVFQPILSTMQGLKPPASLASGHGKLVDSLKILVNGGQGLVESLKGGKKLTQALTSAQLKSLTHAVKGMEHGFTTLHLTTCTRLIGGK
jgi:hypothetical protein